MPDPVITQIQFGSAHRMKGVTEIDTPKRIFLVFVGNALIDQLAIFLVGAHQQYQKPVPPVLGEHIAPAQAVADGCFQLGSRLGGFLGVLQHLPVRVGQPVQKQIGALPGAFQHPAAGAVHVNEAGIAAIVGAPDWSVLL